MLPGKTYAIPELLGILRRRWWLIAVPPVLGLFASLLVSSKLPNVYQAEVLVAIVPQRVPDEFVKSTVTLRTEERIDAISVQVLSRALLEQMILQYDLYPRERAEYPMDAVILKMRANIDVIPERPRQGPRGPEPLHAFRVSYTYPDAAIVADITQRIGVAFVDQNTRDRDALAVATNEFLDSQLAEARQRLELQEARLEAFRERNGNALPTQLSSNMQGSQNTQLQIQALVESAARDRDRKLMLQRLIDEVESDPGMAVTPPPQAQPTTPAQVTGSAAEQLAAARQTLAQLELKFKSQHPDVVRVKRQIQELEPKAAAEAKTGTTEANAALPPATSREELARRERLRDMRAEVESLERQLQFKDSEEQRLRASASEYQRRIDAVPGVEAEWSQLTRDYASTKDLYEDLLSKSEQSKVALDLERRHIGEQFRIVDEARVPDKPVSPVRIQISAAGFGLGLLLGLALGALLEYRDTSFRNEEEVQNVLSIPVLTSVPFVATASERLAHARRRRIAVGLAGVAASVGCYIFWSMQLWNYLV